VIKDFGFIQTHGEACIYKKVSGSSIAFLILYVDVILLIRNDVELLSSVKGYLNKCFSMKDLGEAAYILGIKIYRDRSRRLIGLSQSTYLDKILKKFRMDESKIGFLHMLPGKTLSKTQSPATVTSNIWVFYNDFSLSAKGPNPSWRPHTDGLQDRGGSRVIDGPDDG
jgi:hypothetical protein